MKLVGFAQLRNELDKGNLENWFKCMQSICDYIYIYDQDSTDGSKEYYKNFDNTFVTESPINDFSNETICKKKLLNKLLEDHPDTDWIFWMDGDTILGNPGLDRAVIEKVLLEAERNGHDGIKLGHYNLWRSDIHYRIDNDYHGLHENGVRAFWKNTGKLSFPEVSGLHKPTHPDGMNNVAKALKPPERKDYLLNLIHRGFSTDRQIVDKYILYKSRGQTGANLDRLLDEETLQVVKLDDNILPRWFNATNTQDPTTKDKLKGGSPPNQ